MKLFMTGTLVVLLGLALPEANAAETRAGTLRAHLDTVLLGYEFINSDPENGGESETGIFSVGVGNPRAAVGFGGAVIDDLFVGGRLTLYVEAEEDMNSDADAQRFYWGVLPYVEYLFLSGNVRPFVHGTLGFLGDVNTSGSDDWDAKSAFWGFLIGGGGGIHFFLAQGFSVDLFGLFEYTIGKDDSENGNDVEAALNLIDINLLAGLSGWF